MSFIHSLKYDRSTRETDWKTLLKEKKSAWLYLTSIFYFKEERTLFKDEGSQAANLKGMYSQKYAQQYIGNQDQILI